MILAALTLAAAIVDPGALVDPRLAIGLDEHVGAQLPRELEFTDSTGKPVVLGDLFDGHRPVVLVMAYARCTMLCSVVLRGLADAVRTTTTKPGRDYLPVVVSLDPHETPDEAARRQNTLLADAGHPNDRAAWPYLVGDDRNVAALAAALGFHYAWDPKTEQYAHPAVAFVLTPDGRIAEDLRGVEFDELGPAIERARTGALTPSITQDLLRCFHFDPALQRYGARITLFYRIGAGLVLATTTALVIALFAWERKHKRKRRRRRRRRVYL